MAQLNHSEKYMPIKRFHFSSSEISRYPDSGHLKFKIKKSIGPNPKYSDDPIEETVS
jgi:hypothetical protein